jgi:hypothetical protein
MAYALASRGTPSAVEARMATPIKYPRLLLAIALAVAPVAPLRAQQGYAPGTSRYQVTTSGEGSRDQLGQRQSISYETRQSFTLTLAAAAGDSLALSLTIDSIAGRLSNGLLVPAGAGAGVTIDAAISRMGTVYRSAIRPSTARSTFSVDAEELARFLPPIRAALRGGSRWSDTLVAPTSQLGMVLNRRVVTDYQVLGDTLIDGLRAWRIARSSRSNIDGDGTTMGQNIALRAAATGTGVVIVSDGGVYLGGESRDDVRSTAVIGQPGVAITETQTMRTRVTRLP